jgi:hypothetical protein
VYTRNLALAVWILTLASVAGAAPLTSVSQDRRVSGTLTVDQNAWLPTSNPVFPDFDPPGLGVSGWVALVVMPPLRARSRMRSAGSC